jgi:hypothetical protein
LVFRRICTVLEPYEKALMPPTQMGPWECGV